MDRRNQNVYIIQKSYEVSKFSSLDVCGGPGYVFKRANSDIVL